MSKSKKPTAFQLEDEPASPHFLNDLVPSKRAMALHGFETHRRVYGDEECAARVVAVLKLHEDIGPEDFAVAIEWRDKSLARLLDPSALAAARTLAGRWKVPVESVLAAALNGYQHETPDPDMLHDAAAVAI